MVTEVRRISFDEFAANLAYVFDRVVSEEESVVVEKAGAKVVLVRPMLARRTVRRMARRSAADYEAFLSAAGSWKDVDTDRLVADIYESRRISSRPPVEL